MLDFEEELRKFHKSVEVDDAEEAIFSRDLTDIADALIEVLDTAKKTGDVGK